MNHTALNMLTKAPHSPLGQLSGNSSSSTNESFAQVQRNINLGGLAVNVLVIIMLAFRLMTKTPFSIPYVAWHTIQRFSLWALGAAIVEQTLDFSLLLSRLVGTGEINHILQGFILSLGSVMIWVSAVFLLFAVLHRYERINWQSNLRNTLNLLRSASVLLAIMSVSLYILNLSVTLYYTKDLSAGKYYNATTYVEYICLAFMGGIVLFASVHMVIIVIRGFKAKFNLPARMALLSIKFTSIILAQAILLTLAGVLYFHRRVRMLAGYELAYMDVSILGIAPLYLTLLLLDLLQDHAVVRSMTMRSVGQGIPRVDEPGKSFERGSVDDTVDGILSIIQDSPHSSTLASASPRYQRSGSLALHASFQPTSISTKSLATSPRGMIAV